MNFWTIILVKFETLYILFSLYNLYGQLSKSYFVMTNIDLTFILMFRSKNLKFTWMLVLKLQLLKIFALGYFLCFFELTFDGFEYFGKSIVILLLFWRLLDLHFWTFFLMIS